MSDEESRVNVEVEPYDIVVKTIVDTSTLNALQLLDFRSTVQAQMYRYAWVQLCELLASGVPHIVQFVQVTQEDNWPLMTFTLRVRVGQIHNDAANELLLP